MVKPRCPTSGLAAAELRSAASISPSSCRSFPDSVTLLTLLRPVAVAGEMMCAGLAASRGRPADAASLDGIRTPWTRRRTVRAGS